MKILDLKKYYGAALQKQIDECCGGMRRKQHFLDFWAKSTITGLLYTDPGYEISGPTHRVVISFFNTGLGMYFRNIEQNKLILLPFEHIKTLKIEKKADIIKPMRFSFFHVLMKAGLRYESAKHLLTPKEIVEDQSTTVFISTNDHHFNFILKKNNLDACLESFLQSKLSHILDLNIQPPVFIGQVYVVENPYSGIQVTNNK